MTLDSNTLSTIAAAQLVAGVAGQVVALRRRLPYDVAFPPMSGRPEHVARDSWLLGTALSAPIVMLGTQATAMVQLRRGTNRTATRTLTVLGSLMVYGYLSECVVRQRLSHSVDPVETTVAAAGLGLAIAMAAAGFRSLRPR